MLNKCLFFNTHLRFLNDAFKEGNSKRCQNYVKKITKLNQRRVMKINSKQKILLNTLQINIECRILT